MSSPLLWSLLPIAVGAGLLLYRRNDNLPLFAALTFSLFLTWVAWQIPVDVVLQLGPLSVEIAPNLVLFGRDFTLEDTARTLLLFIYLAQSLWLLGAIVTKPSRLFSSISLIAVGLFVAALCVDPFLYAALILAAAVLILIPLIVRPGELAGRGVQRFLKFQLLAVPCILFTGWLLTGVEASPGNVNLVLRAGLLLALGFGFLLGLFPFHSWMPMLCRETNPYVFGFIVFFLPAISMVFALGFFDRYVWLRENSQSYQLLLYAGSLNVFLSGCWAATQRNLGRMFAFAAMLATGGLLQAVGLGGSEGVLAFFALLLPQAIALWALSFSLSLLWKGAGSLDLEDLDSVLGSRPLLSLSVAAGFFALAGLPLLGAFSAHLSIWRGLGERSIVMLVLSMLGSVALMAAGVRVLLAWLRPHVKSSRAKPKDEFGGPIQSTGDHNPYIWTFVVLWVVLLLGFGLLPRFFLGSVPALAAMFPQLFP